MPAHWIWGLVLGREAGLGVVEDDDATMSIIKTGKNPALRHVSRTHGVNVAWLHEVFQRPEFRLIGGYPVEPLIENSTFFLFYYFYFLGMHTVHVIIDPLSVAMSTLRGGRRR